MSENEEYEEMSAWSKMREGNRYTAILNGNTVKFEVKEKMAYAGTNTANNTRWEVNYVFRTATGTLMYLHCDISRWQGEPSTYDLKKLNSIDDLTDHVSQKLEVHRSLMTKWADSLKK